MRVIKHCFSKMLKKVFPRCGFEKEKFKQLYFLIQVLEIDKLNKGIECVAF